ncbi:MAG: chemotaxis protein CheW [Leptolyngbyaceae cyanobacterium MAG.088]|nr:chemotaxis protein CheW [Leptolyngbyaceae cyanobacterium MAG.088]
MELDEDLKAFLLESNENLNQIEVDLVALEQETDSADVMNRIYRALHTLKGNCGFLGFEILQSVAHAGENLLSRLRDRHLIITPAITTALLQVVDAIQQILATLETTGTEGDSDYTSLLERLEQLQAGTTVGSELTTPLAVETAEELDDNEPALITSSATSISNRNIRVDVVLLDKLMNLVGELVLCRNQILEYANNQENKSLIDTSQRLNIVTTELQEGIMQTRMQPIRNIWSKFPRVVRDLSLSLDKQVQLEMEGEETELDKTLIEAIADPLTHLVRNCVDHGIEIPSERLLAGKPEVGKLFLRAFHESGYVNIEIADNGKGIDAGQIKIKALQRGLITTEQAARMSEQETLNLIFSPGLSTAEQVTNLSGRGVGMDVVQTNIDRIGGSIDVSSQPGQGTSFKLKIPLTLAIIPTLIVSSGGERYAIPQVSLIELVRLEGDQAKRGVEMVHGAPVYRLRGKLLPLVYLNQELQLDTKQKKSEPDYTLPSALTDMEEATSALQESTDEDEIDVLNILVLQATDKPFGLLVDAINDTQEIVVKPLGKQLKGLSCFAGATIMGDGQVALILDVQGLAQRAHVISDAQEASLLAEGLSQTQTDIERQMLLLFEGPNGRHMALPLDQVTRLEKISSSKVEGTYHKHVIQYREQILPLIYLSSVLANQPESSPPPMTTDETIAMVVVSVDEHNHIGLVVENIIDIVEEQILIKGTASQPEIQYSAVIQNRITELIDVNAIIRAGAPALLQTAS